MAGSIASITAEDTSTEGKATTTFFTGDFGLLLTCACPWILFVVSNDLCIVELLYDYRVLIGNCKWLKICRNKSLILSCIR